MNIPKNPFLVQRELHRREASYGLELSLEMIDQRIALAIALLKKGESGSADVQCQRAGEQLTLLQSRIEVVSPKMVQVLLVKGQVCIAQGKQQESLKWYRAALFQKLRSVDPLQQKSWMKQHGLSLNEKLSFWKSRPSGRYAEIAIWHYQLRLKVSETWDLCPINPMPHPFPYKSLNLSRFGNSIFQYSLKNQGLPWKEYRNAKELHLLWVRDALRAGEKAGKAGIVTLQGAAVALLKEHTTEYISDVAVSLPLALWKAYKQAGKEKLAADWLNRTKLALERLERAIGAKSYFFRIRMMEQ